MQEKASEHRIGGRLDYLILMLKQNEPTLYVGLKGETRKKNVIAQNIGEPF